MRPKQMAMWTGLGLAAALMPVLTQADEEKIAYGEYLSGACVTCHQLTGIDNGIPSIVGWEEQSFVSVLQAYQKGEREHQVMRMITEPLTLEEMEALAAFFKTQKATGETGEKPLFVD